MLPSWSISSASTWLLLFGSWASHSWVTAWCCSQSSLSVVQTRSSIFFCDNTPLFQLSCSDTSLLWKIDSVFLLFIVLSSLCLTLASYTGIFLCILQMPAASGRKKAFATCSSHLTTLAIAYGSCIALYACPSGHVSLETNSIVALLNTVLYPFLNPFIYSLRNKAVMLALKEAMACARAQLFPPIMMHFWRAIWVLSCHILCNTTITYMWPPHADASRGLCSC